MLHVSEAKLTSQPTSRFRLNSAGCELVGVGAPPPLVAPPLQAISSHAVTSSALVVLGLSFNCQYINMLACAAHGEKLRIYYLDYPDEFASRGNGDLSIQMTFLEWNPIFPAVIVSTCNTGATKLWDLREKSSKATYMRTSDNGLSFSEVHWNPSDPCLFALACKDNCQSPIKIWDVRNNKKVLYEFGNAKGVSSLSWSSSGLITTTALDGFIYYWRKNENKKEPASWSSLASGFHEAHWCPFDATLAAITSQNLEVYRMPADQCVWGDPRCDSK